MAGGGSGGSVRGPQSLVAGVALVVLAGLALWFTRDLSQGTLRAMGPAMLPRWLAIGVGACGIALVVAAFVQAGHALESVTYRGPVMVVLGVVAFGIAIRGMEIGPVTIPSLGLIVAGPLGMFVAGFATDETRPRELLILSLMLTAGCMVLFGDLLNLPIPMFPQWVADLYPAGWSSDGRLRATAAILAGAGLALLPLGSRRAAREPVDVVTDERAGVV